MSRVIWPFLAAMWSTMYLVVVLHDMPQHEQRAYARGYAAARDSCALREQLMSTTDSLGRHPVDVLEVRCPSPN